MIRAGGLLVEKQLGRRKGKKTTTHTHKKTLPHTTDPGGKVDHELTICLMAKRANSLERRMLRGSYQYG